MKSAYKSVTFYIGQKELEMQFKVNKLVAQYQQKCEMMQEKFAEKFEQVRTAYQKVAKKCQMLEQEIESLSKDKQELQEKFAEKSRFLQFLTEILFVQEKKKKFRWNCKSVLKLSTIIYWLRRLQSVRCFTTGIHYLWYMLSELT